MYVHTYNMLSRQLEKFEGFIVYTTNKCCVICLSLIYMLALSPLFKSFHYILVINFLILILLMSIFNELMLIYIFSFHILTFQVFYKVHFSVLYLFYFKESLVFTISLLQIFYIFFVKPFSRCIQSLQVCHLIFIPLSLNIFLIFNNSLKFWTKSFNHIHSSSPNSCQVHAPSHAALLSVSIVFPQWLICSIQIFLDKCLNL